MNNNKVKILLLILSFILIGCYPDSKNTLIKQDNIKNYKKINSPSKIFIKDGSVILMKNGFTINENLLRGRGNRFLINGQLYVPQKSDTNKYQTSLQYQFKLTNDSIIIGAIEKMTDDSIFIRKSPTSMILLPKNQIQDYTLSSEYIAGERNQMIPLDSIAAITYYTSESSGTKTAGDIMIGTLGAAITGLAVYCISCPKCCFGSCPTVYTFDGNRYNLEVELFSQCIARKLENNDLDLLMEKIPTDSIYRLKLTNEALETHYINRFTLLNVVHPKGTLVYPSSIGEIISVQNLMSPTKVFNSYDENVTYLINSADNIYYRSDSSMVKNLRNKIFKDNLNFQMKAPDGCKNAKIVIRYRNTLMSTVLFYDMVLGSQGVKAIDWLEKMNNDPIYAAQFKMVYKIFSGISVKSNNDNQWNEVGHFDDAGPINWKYVAVYVPVNTDGMLDVKLEFFPDNFMIDYIGVDFSGNIPFEANDLTADEIHDNLKNKRMDIDNMFERDDNKYLVTNPGECFYFTYKIKKNENMENTLFISSKGYYTEWLRGKWITASDTPFEFSLYNIGGTIKELAYRWIEDRNMMEQEFFRNKIPIKEGELK